jgi:hypothetical protein
MMCLLQVRVDTVFAHNLAPHVADIGKRKAVSPVQR